MPIAISQSYCMQQYKRLMSLARWWSQHSCWCVQVTKLNCDPSSRTTLQEINFWLSLERALQRIQEKRDSLEVTLTLDILKTHGKRFNATASFDKDTGESNCLFCCYYVLIFLGLIQCGIVRCIRFSHRRCIEYVMYCKDCMLEFCENLLSAFACFSFWWS